MKNLLLVFLILLLVASLAFSTQKYIYNNVITTPNLDGIHYGVINSTINIMANKNIQWCRWDEDSTILKVFFDVDLSTGDKDILDQIIEDNK